MKRKKRIQADIDQLNKLYQDCADQMTFRAEIMRDYASNHLERGFKLYKLVMDAKKPNVFEKATAFDTFRGVTFDRSAFQSEVQEGFLKPLRYLLQTYNELNYNMIVRGQVRKPGTATSKPEIEYRDMTLGEKLFGYELLNRKEFWKIKDGKVQRENGRNVIDYAKVNSEKGKIFLWKQWALMKIAADLYAHRAKNSTDPSFNLTYYENAIEAIGSIPGEIWGDEMKMQGLKIGESFFNKKDIAWLREISGTTRFSLYSRSIAESLLWPKDDKDGTGLGDAFGNFFKAISPGAQLY